jgi:hypothetical protein
MSARMMVRGLVAAIATVALALIGPAAAGASNA